MRKLQIGFKAIAMLISLIAVVALADATTGGAVRAAVTGLCQCGDQQCQGCSPEQTSATAPVTTADCGCAAAPSAIVYIEPTPVYTTPVASCGCNKKAVIARKPRCKSCRSKKSCPQCDCQFCELDVKKGEVEKSSYKVEQKEVCVPAVRLPWKRNCPPKRSKVRTVNTLKKHKYKCPKCEYKWSVHEPEDFDSSAGSEEAKNEVPEVEVPVETSGSGTKSIYVDPADAFGDIPRPPMEK